jgi:hypothetical protein
MRRLFTQRRYQVIAVLAVALLVAAGAAAYFTSTGSGSGSSTTGTAQDFTLHPGALSGALFPGGTAVDVKVLVDNPNSFSVHLNGVVLDASHGTHGFSIDGGGHAGCDPAVFGFNAPQNNSGAGWDIPAGNNNPITLTGAVSMTTASDTACQGATFDVYLKAAS